MLYMIGRHHLHARPVTVQSTSQPTYSSGAASLGTSPAATLRITVLRGKSVLFHHCIFFFLTLEMAVACSLTYLLSLAKIMVTQFTFLRR